MIPKAATTLPIAKVSRIATLIATVVDRSNECEIALRHLMPGSADVGTFHYKRIADIDECIRTDSDAVLVVAPGSCAHNSILALRQVGCSRPALAVLTDCSVPIATMLDSGADDVLEFARCAAELAPRLRALIRRAPIHRDAGHFFEVDPAVRAIRLANVTVTLSPLPFRLLVFLIQNRGRWVPRSEILESVFGLRRDPKTSVLRFHIHTIRKALGDYRRCVLEDRRGSYMFLIPTQQERGGESEIARYTSSVGKSATSRARLSSGQALPLRTLSASSQAAVGDRAGGWSRGPALARKSDA